MNLNHNKLILLCYYLLVTIFHTYIQVSKQDMSEKKTSSSKNNKKTQQETKGVREDLEELDSEEQYYKFAKENPDAGMCVLTLNFILLSC